MNPRSEPLLWLQLVALGAIPLELLGLLLMLAGADPGPLPGLERLLAWAIGGLGPAILLWRRPADVCSLLLVQVPLKARSEAQRSLAAAQSPLAVRVAMVLGAASLLPLFWWLDQHAALAAPLSPLAASPRFVCLLLACPLLAVMVWQWQQLIQAVALLSRRAGAGAAEAPLSSAQLETQRLSLGLPLLLLNPLQISQPQLEPEPEPEPESVSEPEPEPEPASGPEVRWPAEEDSAISPEPSVSGSVAIKPEQAAEQAEGTDLDEEIR